MVCKVAPRLPARLLPKVVGRDSPLCRIEVLRLSDRDRDAFTRAVEGIKLDPYKEYKKLLRPMGKIFRETIDPNICRILREMAAEQKIHAVLLKNCPLSSDLPNTPKEDERSPTKGFVEELFMEGLTRIEECQTFRDPDEGRGYPFSQLTTVKGQENSHSSKGLEFGAHTEHVHQEKTIDIVDLFCIRGDLNTITGVISAESLIEGLPGHIVDLMQKQIFRMQTGPSWPHKKMEGNFPILEKNKNGDFNIRFNSDFANRMVAIDDRAREVLEHLKKQLQRSKKWEVTLEDGDCLSINNRRAVHYRTQSPYQAPSPPWNRRRWVIGQYKMTAL